MPPQPIPEVWTEQAFDFTEQDVLEYDGGTYGVPEDLVPAIADAVLHTLASLGIDPQSVYLSGHDGQEPESDAVKGERAAREDFSIRESDWTNESWVRTPDMPTYFMSGVGELRSDADSQMNPIHFAGISSGSTLVVYNGPVINGLRAAATPEVYDDNPAVTTTAEALGGAILAHIRLRYRIEGEPAE